MLAKVREIRPHDAEVATLLRRQPVLPEEVQGGDQGVPGVDQARREEPLRLARASASRSPQDDKAEDAVAALEKAKALKADDQPTLLVLGDLYLNDLENLEKALENYKAYVKAGGNNPDVPLIIEEIEKQLDAKKK